MTNKGGVNYINFDIEKLNTGGNVFWAFTIFEGKLYVCTEDSEYYIFEGKDKENFFEWVSGGFEPTEKPTELIENGYKPKTKEFYILEHLDLELHL